MPRTATAAAVSRYRFRRPCRIEISRNESFVSASGEALEFVPRFRRLRSLRNSAALWYRTSRFFSNALVMICSNPEGRAGFTLVGGIGFSWRIASKITAIVVPWNAQRAVAISYSTAPKLNRSVRVSSSSPPKVCRRGSQRPWRLRIALSFAVVFRRRTADSRLHHGMWIDRESQ
jgi:hypothetical protein